MSERRRTVVRALRVVLGIGAVGWIVHRIDPTSLRTALSALSFPTLLAAFACIALSAAIAAYRWGVLLEAYGGVRPRYFDLARYLLEGLFLANLPTGLAGDAARGLRLRDNAGGIARSYAVIIVERILGLCGLFAVIVVCLAVTESPARVRTTLHVAAIVGGVFAVLLFAFTAFAARLRSVPLVGPLAERIGAPRLDRISWALLLSVGTQVTILASMVILVHAVARDANVFAIAELAPFALLAVIVPLTPGGAGQREIVFAELFALAGVAKEAAVAASLVWFALGLVLALLGAVQLMCDPRR